MSEGRGRTNNHDRGSGSMYLRILKRDLKRKKTMNLILLIFITLAAMFIASGANNLLTVMTALDSYFERAEVPDDWILFSERTEMERAVAFAEENGYVYRQTEAVQINPKEVYVSGEVFDYNNTLFLATLGGSRVFDCEENELTEIRDGEIYVVSYIWNSGKNDFYEGAELVITVNGVTRRFTVKGYIKDALYGSSMSGMARFLISENDYAFLKGNAAVYDSLLIYTDDPQYEEKLSALDLNTTFQVNGYNVKQMYLMDMLMAATILIVSVCLILISMVILHFAINFTMSEEFREIGVMKAIGIPNLGIRGLYIAKYLAISVTGAAAGFCLSIPFGSLLLKNASNNIIIAADLNIWLHLLCVAAAAVIVVAFCFFCTRKVKKFSPIDAIRNGETGERYSRKGFLHLSRGRLPVIPFMAVNDIFSELRKYVSMLVIFMLGLLLVVIPANTINTLSSDKLIRWFNMADCDLVISQELLFTSNGDNKGMAEEKLAAVRGVLKENGIEAEVYQEIIFRMSIEHGDKKMSSLAFQGIGGVTTDMYAYIEGTPPQNNNEVAISHYVAKKLDARIGDDVTINTGGTVKAYTVTAINQSMNNMGEGIRFYQGEELDYSYVMGSFGIQIRFPDEPDAELLKQRKELLKQVYPEEKICGAGEYISEMLGSPEEMVEEVKTLNCAVIFCINVLVAVLMVKSIMHKEKGEIAILKAVGFQNAALILWQTLRIGIIYLLAAALGSLLSTPLSKLMIEPVFRMMGAYSIEFEIKAFEVYVFYPLILLAAAAAAAFLTAQGIRKISASEASGID